MRTERVGVFNDGGLWKVFQDVGRTRRFSTRGEAIACAETLARDRAGLGRAVELYVEQLSGDLQRVASSPAAD